MRDPDSESAAEIAATDAHIAVCDLDDADQIAAALDGAYSLFLYQPGFMSRELTPGLGPDSELARGRAVIDAARSAGIGQLVYSSGLGANVGVRSHCRRSRGSFPATTPGRRAYLDSVAQNAARSRRVAT